MSTLGSAPTLAAQADAADRSSAEAIAASVHATDVLVLRPTADPDDDIYVLVGGAGRGAQWAGGFEVSLAEEPVFAEAARAVAPMRVNTPRPARVVGAYHAAGAVIVPVLPGLFVVFGTTHGTFTDFPDTVWQDAAERAAAVALEVPAERLVEEQQRADAALAALNACPGTELFEVMTHVAATAAEELGCEVGIVHDRATGRVAVSDRGWPWPPHLGVRDIEQAMGALWERGVDDLLCVQDLAAGGLPGAIGPTSRLVSAVIAPLGGGWLLALGHNESRPRGFTSACLDLVDLLAEAAVPLLQAAAPPDSQELVSEEAERAARIDPQTGLVNELGWSELLAHAESRTSPPSGGIVFVVRPALRVGADEAALGSLARTVQQAVRQQDMVARVGDDVLAVLVREGTSSLAETMATRLQPNLSGHGAVLGWAARPPGGSLADAYRAAQQRADHRRIAALAARRR